LLSLFGPKLPIDRDELEWQLATFKWLGQEFGRAAETPLVLPTPEYFPSAPLTGPERAEALFADVKRAAGMEAWPCELRAGREDRPAKVGTALLLRHEGAAPPCGTFMVDGADGQPQVVITYNPSLVMDTGAMIATFAHELGHYLMSTAQSAPPGGWELHELHTDLAAVYLGFGIFLANSARNFGQFQDASEMGWSSRSQGYLSEGALVTALAIFQGLGGRDPLEAGPFLKPYLEGDLKAAAKYLARYQSDMAASVAAIDLDAFVRD
jgi:hypothetical protein